MTKETKWNILNKKEKEVIWRQSKRDDTRSKLVDYLKDCISAKEAFHKNKFVDYLKYEGYTKRDIDDVSQALTKTNIKLARKEARKEHQYDKAYDSSRKEHFRKMKERR